MIDLKLSGVIESFSIMFPFFTQWVNVGTRDNSKCDLFLCELQLKYAVHYTIYAPLANTKALKSFMEPNDLFLLR